MSSHEVTVCRACLGRTFESILELGDHPAPNHLLDVSGEVYATYPLRLRRCACCGLLQLANVVSPEILYANYPFVSGVSAGWRKHCNDLAESLGEVTYAIDIGGNDGTMARALKDQGAKKVMVVDPNISGDTDGVPEFWSQSVADRMFGWHGAVDCIVAQNVFGHVSDTRGFLQACATVLRADGRIVVECPYEGSMLDNLDYGQIYHEHLSYWRLGTLSVAAAGAGLYVESVCDLPEIHGGSMRYILRRWDQRREVSASVHSMKIREIRLESAHPHWAFAKKACHHSQVLAEKIRGLEGRSVWAYGASAKLVTLLTMAGVIMEAVIDDTPSKQGKLLPIREGIPIVPMPELTWPDVIVIGAWNWGREMREKLIEAGFTGTILVPFPKPTLTDLYQQAA